MVRTIRILLESQQSGALEGIHVAIEHYTQFCTAWALARAHSHGWATEIPFSEIVLAVEHASTPEEACAEIRELYDRFAIPFGIRGIDCPEFDGPNIVHETVTGRLSWTVWPDGGVTFLVATPYGVVAQADVSAPEVAWADSREYDEPIPYIRRRVNMWARNARPRHIRALNRAISVLNTEPGNANGDVLAMARYVQYDSIVQRDMPGVRSLRVVVDLDGRHAYGPGVHFEGTWKDVVRGVFVPVGTPFHLNDLAREFAYLSYLDPCYAPLAMELGFDESDVDYYRSD